MIILHRRPSPAVPWARVGEYATLAAALDVIGRHRRSMDWWIEERRGYAAAPKHESPAVRSVPFAHIRRRA